MDDLSECARAIDELRLQVARLEGEVRALESQLAKSDATDEHRRVELEAARAEAGDARAAEREWQGRLEESRGTIAELRTRLVGAEGARERAEEERSAVIVALGRKARRRLADRDQPG